MVATPLAEPGRARPIYARIGSLREPGMRHRAAVLLVLLVSVGSVKASPLLSFIPLDPTLLVALLVSVAALDAAAGAVKRRERLRLGWLLGAAGVLGLGMYQFHGSDHAFSKTLALTTLTLGCSFGGALLLTRHPRQREAFYRGTLVVGVLVALLLLLTPATDPALSDRLALAGTNTIGPARVVAAGLVVLLVWTMIGRIRPLVGLGLALPLMALLISTGSRGPLAALGLATLAVLPFVTAKARWRATLVLIVAALVGWRSLSDAPAGVRHRFMLLFSDDQGSSVRVRQELWDASINSILSAPLGRGWGGLEPVLNPYGTYPHNLVLEAAAEAGVIAALALVVAIVIGLARLVRAIKAPEPQAVVALALLVFWLANASVSGDINDNRAVFVLLALAINVAHSHDRPHQFLSRARRSRASSPRRSAARPFPLVP